MTNPRLQDLQNKLNRLKNPPTQGMTLEYPKTFTQADLQSTSRQAPNKSPKFRPLPLGVLISLVTITCLGIGLYLMSAGQLPQTEQAQATFQKPNQTKPNTAKAPNQTKTGQLEIPDLTQLISPSTENLILNTRTILGKENTCNLKNSQNNPKCNLDIPISQFALPEKGLWHSLKLEANIAGQSQLTIYLVDQQDKVYQELGTLTPAKPRQELPLPLQIPDTHKLRLRFQTEDLLQVNRLEMSYLHPDNLRQVSGNIILDQPDSTLDLRSGKIYYDRNRNQLLDDTDLIWECLANFPGVVVVPLNPLGKFELRRKDQCPSVDQTSSDSSTQASLPKGNWLLVFNQGQYVYPFAIPEEGRIQ